MTRSSGTYDEDWQRRKAMLVRSLFHDIPILSPVEEESSDSCCVPTQEAFASPQRPYTPLPPLIIEKVPITNKHDEPEEYYSKLYKKIKGIYTKLFIEKRNCSSIDYASNYSEISAGDDRENNSAGSIENLDSHLLESNSPDNGNFDSSIEDGKARQRSASTESDGYGADFESMDTEIIDVDNYTPSNEESIMISEEEASDSENIDGDGIRNEDSDNSRSSGNKESSRERIDDREFSGGEESHNSSIVGHENTESEESNETEDEQDEPNDVTKSKQYSYEKQLKSKDFEKTTFEDLNNLIESKVVPMVGDEEISDSSEGPVYRQITTAAMVHYDGSQDAGDRESPVYEDSAKSVILPTRFRRALGKQNVDVDDRIEVLPILKENAESITVPTFYTHESESTEEDIEEVATPQLDAEEEGIIEMRTPQADAPEEDDQDISSSSSGEEDDEEISTSQPDSAEEDLEGIKSLQPRARDEETEEMGIEEEDEEMSIPQPDSAEEDVEEMGSPHTIEQMRTPRLDISHGTIPITHRSHSESTSEHTAVPQELTALTSSTQDGADHNMSEIHTSNDMHEILTSIFNESRNKDKTPISGRKRKLKVISVQATQTSRVTWEEMRANFFVGTPKIFRLCSCTDHNC